MNDTEAKLAAFWRMERPRAQDAAFRVAVMERRVRQRLRAATAWIAIAGVFAVALIVFLVPLLPVWTPSPTTLAALPFLSVLGTCACLMWVFMRGRAVV
jgi:hypothetical protein